MIPQYVIAVVLLLLITIIIFLQRDCLFNLIDFIKTELLSSEFRKCEC